LDITYKNIKIQKICTDAKVADRTYGNEIQIAHIMEIVDYH
jgi:proteic killer suppression protein